MFVAGLCWSRSFIIYSSENPLRTEINTQLGVLREECVQYRPEFVLCVDAILDAVPLLLARLEAPNTPPLPSLRVGRAVVAFHSGIYAYVVRLDLRIGDEVFTIWARPDRLYVLYAMQGLDRDSAIRLDALVQRMVEAQARVTKDTSILPA